MIIDDAAVSEIRRLWAVNRVEIRRLAALFGTSKTTVGRIIASGRPDVEQGLWTVAYAQPWPADAMLAVRTDIEAGRTPGMRRSGMTLDAEAVRKARDLAAAGHPQWRIAELLGVSQPRVCRALKMPAPTTMPIDAAIAGFRDAGALSVTSERDIDTGTGRIQFLDMDGDPLMTFANIAQAERTMGVDRMTIAASCNATRPGRWRYEPGLPPSSDPLVAWGDALPGGASRSGRRAFDRSK